MCAWSFGKGNQFDRITTSQSCAHIHNTTYTGQEMVHEREIEGHQKKMFDIYPNTTWCSAPYILSQRRRPAKWRAVREGEGGRGKTEGEGGGGGEALPYHLPPSPPRPKWHLVLVRSRSVANGISAVRVGHPQYAHHSFPNEA